MVMKFILKPFLTLFITSLLIHAFANDQLTYSKVLLKVKDQSAFTLLAKHDIYIDHMAKAKNGVVVVFNNEELATIKSLNIQYDVLIQDLEKHHQKRIEEEMQNPEVQKAMKSQSANSPGFGFGSHAGYYTPFEMNSKLDEIAMSYPSIAANKVSIGTTFEGRNIYMLKISDNPNIDESATEATVYYDAMHHAREPLSMMTTLYYMFWLVENYGSDPEATYLVDNREQYFVPIVNVDGYAYNITTNPFGGGFWRKNRRPDPGGSGCVGTDPNRNYGADWGGPGASTNPCSDTYRGDGPFSEPCTQAVRDLLLSINPVMAFSNHSYSEIYIESDWNAASAEQYYADYSLDICEEHDFGYEQGESLLYAVSGATTEFLNSLGAISYTPEIGSEFWELMSEITPYAEKHLPAFIYIASVAGDYPDIKQATINSGNDILPGQNYNIDVEIFNKGRTQTANNVTVQVVNQSANVTAVNSSTTLASVGARQTAWSNNPLSIAISNTAVQGDIVEVELSVTANGIEYERETQRWVVGNQNILFAEDGSNGLGGFYSSGFGVGWDTVYVMKRSGNEGFADSPLQAADNLSQTYLTMSAPVSLNGAIAPRLEYWIAWGVSNFNTFSYGDIYEDHITIEVRQDGGSWIPINTNDTQNINGGPRYVLNHAWAKQIVDLSSYVGSNVEFRFMMSASYSSEPDGVFIDDFRIVDYSSSCGTTITFDNFPTSTSSTQPINLLATPPGGVFSGPGVVFNAFNPSITGQGFQTITYTYTDADGCTSTASADILVFNIVFNFVTYSIGTINPKIINPLDIEIEVPEKDRFMR